MSKPTIYVVTKNGAKVSQPLPLAEANKQANELRSICESQAEKAAISVVPVVMG